MAHPNHELDTTARYHKPWPGRTQAERVFRRFGGGMRLFESLQRLPPGLPRPTHRKVVYGWAAPRSRGGMGGLVPSRWMPSVLAAARMEGIILTAEDLDPRERNE